MGIGGSLDVVIDHRNFAYQRAPVKAGDRGFLGPTGILSSSNRNGLVVTNTLWQGADDDTINSDAGVMAVEKVDGATLTFDGGSVTKGNTLSFYDDNGSFVGRARTVDEPIRTETPTDAEPNRCDWHRVTLDQSLKLPAKSHAYNIDHTSLGFTMKNCVFQNFRDVGLIICGENALIENCVFDSGTVCAIVCEGYSSNLIIRNNVFSNNGFRWDYGNTDGGRNAGAIQMGIQGDQSGAFIRTAQLYEAEKALVTQGRIGSDASASGAKFVSGLTHEMSSVKFSVQAPASGQYALVLAYDNASRDENGSPLMATQTVIVNGAKAGSLIYPFTGFWAQFHPTYASSIIVPLKAGRNTIEFRHALKSAELDNLRVVPLN